MDPTIIKTIAITVCALGLLVVLPIIALLLEHQRKMARLIRGEKVEETDTAVVVGVHAVGGGKGSTVKALEERVIELERELSAMKAMLPDRIDEEMRARQELQN